MTAVDTDRFRLRRFIEKLVQLGECEIHERPINLVDIASVLDGNPNAVWFTAVGPEKAELVGNVMGSRRRLALALDTDERGLVARMSERMSAPHKPIKVSSQQAPVHEVVRTGDDADMCALPVHLHHGNDGAPYISAGLDFSLFTGNGRTNIGCRRLMLRGPRHAGINLVAPTDLRAIYLDAVGRGEKLPVAFVVGAHPADCIAAAASMAPMDELDLLGAVRGARVPIVKCVTSDIWVPADAEYVLEGYLDPRGQSGSAHGEIEGPFGEYLGYYGVVKSNPVFHLTAITHRKDALFQTVTIGGRHLALTDTAQLTTMKSEAAAWTALKGSIAEPVAVHATPSSGGMYNMRVSMRQRHPGEPRNAIATVFGSRADAKNVFVFDEDIDVFSDQQVDWALATRFQANRDLIVANGFRTTPLDPSLDGARTNAKIGFDCTIPFGKTKSIEWAIPAPPVMPQRKQQSVEEALADGPASFLDLMAACCTSDGREIVRELDKLYARDRLGRQEDGRYVLRNGGK